MQKGLMNMLGIIQEGVQNGEYHKNNSRCL
jgi:hypothetical protein